MERRVTIGHYCTNWINSTFMKIKLDFQNHQSHYGTIAFEKTNLFSNNIFISWSILFFNAIGISKLNQNRDPPVGTTCTVYSCVAGYYEMYYIKR